MDFEIKIPDYVNKVIDNLEAEGFEAFVVGGCVRDSVMGKSPSDWDVCTNALPEQTVAVFEDKMPVIPTGIKHGTVTALSDGKPIEITVYRSESGYEDCRHPSDIKFLSQIDGDLSRRDFTVNAMAYNPKTGIIDLFGGRKDLEAGILRCVGDANSRFREDALRIMRALRFAAVCSLEIEAETANAIRKNRGLLEKISVERIYAELKKILTADEPSQILIEYRDVFEVIMPEAFGDESFCADCCRAADRLPKTEALRLAAILYPSRAAYDILTRLKTDKETRNRVCAALETAEEELPQNRTEIKKLLSTKGAEAVCDALELNAALKNDDRYINILEIINDIHKKGECCTLSQLALGGADLIQLGYKPGREMGELLNCLLTAVIEGRAENEKNSLLTYLESKEN